jgi:ATP synthase F1 delta subunit
MAVTTNKDIAHAIYLATKGETGASLDSRIKDVVKFLDRKRLMSKAGAILESLEKIINKEEGRLEVQVWSAQKLEPTTIHDLKHFIQERYGAKDIILKEKVDESLVGGMKIEVNDEVIDLTMKNKITKLQEYLTRNI